MNKGKITFAQLMPLYTKYEFNKSPSVTMVIDIQ